MKKQIKKIILEFPATQKLSEESKLVAVVGIEKDKEYSFWGTAKRIDDFNVEIEISFLRLGPTR